jgi:hypothetical protein
MSDPALVFISSTIYLVRVIALAACISGFAVVSAQAGDRWPQNVCNELASEEEAHDMFFSDRPEVRALARVSLLRLLQDHCGVDTRAKMKADDAALGEADRAEARRSRPHGPLNCTIRSLGDGHLSTMTCP